MAITSHAKALFTFLKEIYGPQVAILATNEVRGMFWKNGLTIKEFFEPLSNLNIEWTLRDPSGLGSGSGSSQNIHSAQANAGLLGTYKIRTLHVNIAEVTGPDNPPISSELLDQVVQEELDDIAKRLVPVDESLANSPTELPGPIATSSNAYPWYNSYRRCWLQNIPVMEHEYLRYYVSVLLMVSSNQSDPIAIFEQLNLKLASMIQKQQETKPEDRFSQPKFLTEHLLKTYVLLHDMSNSNLTQAESIYSMMQSKYSPKHCHFLKINSTSTVPPTVSDSTQHLDIWQKNLRFNRDLARRMNRQSNSKIGDSTEKNQATKIVPTSAMEDSAEPNAHTPPNLIIHRVGQYMSAEDIELVTQFLHDYINWSLLPHLETLMRVLYEKVNSHNKISRLFSSFKKYTTNKSATPPHVGLDQFSEIYTTDSVELHMRMLGDISFMLQNWELAYNMYHGVKKDFQADQAWWLYAGAVEMTALSVFMLPTIKKDAVTYFDECFQQYFTICKSIKYALRALMLWGEVLKAKAMYFDASIVYTKLGAKVDDLCSSMLLEQAALCMMSRKPIRPRKAAQLMVLSSHMYTKSNHPRHSVRLLKQSLVSIQGKSWIAAEDYLLHLLGKHSSFLGKKDFAYTLFESLLSHDPKIYFQFVSPSKQEEILKEFLVTFQENKETNQGQQIVIFSEDCSYNSTKQLLPLPIPKVDCTLIRTSWCSGCLEFAFTSRFEAVENASAFYVNAGDEELELCKGGRERRELVSRRREVLLKRPSKGSSVFKSSITLDSPIHQPIGFKQKISTINIGTAQFAYSGSLQTSEWKALEMSAIKLVTGKKLSPNAFRSLAPFLNPKTNNLTRGICVSQECICVEILLRNPLNVSLILSDIALQWVLEADTGEQTVLSEIISTYKLPACGQRLLQLQLQPLVEQGILHVTGLLYSVEPSSGKLSPLPENDDPLLSSFNKGDDICTAQGVLELSVRGNRLNESKEHKTNVLYAPDYRLQWEIVPAMPRLFLRFQHWPTHLLSGEIYTIPIELYNCGTLTLHNMIVSSPNYASFLFNFDSKSDSTIIARKGDEMESMELKSETNISRRINFEPLQPAQGVKGTLVIIAPVSHGEHEMNFLFYYDTIHETKIKQSLPYRIHTHTAYLQVLPSINAHSIITQTNINDDNNIQAFGSFSIENIGKDGSPETYKIISIIAISKEWRVNVIPGTYDESTLELEPCIITQLYYLATKNNENIQNQNSNQYTVATLLEIEKSPETDYNYDLLTHQDEFKALANSQSQFSILFLIKWKTMPLDDVKPHYGTYYITPTYVDPWKDPTFSHANLTKPKDLSQKSMARSPHQLINYVLIHPNDVMHDFATKPLCFQKVQVNLQNISGQIVYVKVQFNVPLNESKRSFSWVGNVVRKIKLEPFELLSNEHKIVFSEVGVYNLMNFTITASANQKGNFLPQYGPKVSYVFLETNCNTLIERK